MILTTGIGSVPLTSFQDAAEYVCEHYTLPFLPETMDTRTRLPAMLTHMLTDEEVQMLEAGNWPHFADRLRNHPDQFSQLYDLPLWESATSDMHRKAQMIGPTTLVSLLANFFPNEPGSKIEEVALPFHRARFANLIKAIGTNSATTFLTLDEPLMNDRNMSVVHANLAPLKELTTGHRQLKLGIHCCAPIRLDLFADTCQGLGLAFDMTLAPEAEIPAARRILQNEWLIFGTVDTSRNPINVEAAMEKAKEMQRTWLPADFSGRTIISGGCGTGRRTFFYEETVAKCLSASTKLLLQDPIGKGDVPR